MVQVIGRKILDEQGIQTIQTRSSSDGFWSKNIQTIGINTMSLDL